MDFHLTLGELSGNPVLAQILRELRSVFLDQMAGIPWSMRLHETTQAILQAVERGDVDGAQRAMERHLDRMYDFYLADGEDNHEWRDAP